MTTPEAPPGRPAWRPGLRTTLEVALIAAAVAGYVHLRRRGEFPRPLARALRHGTTAERIEALRHLSLFGRAGEAAIPALLDALHDDPSPVLRRGAAYVLAAVATAPLPGEAFSLDLLVADSQDPSFDRSAKDRPPPPLQPDGRDVAAGLARAIGDDPDPTVRRQAVVALGDVLNAATGTRPPSPVADLMGDEGQPRPPAPRPVEPWMIAAARALAGHAGSADPAVRGAAATWAHVNPSATILLGGEGRFDALRAGARAALRAGQPAREDPFLVKLLALEARRAPGRRDVVLDLLAGAMTGPHAPGAAIGPNDQAVPYWMAGPSARQLRAHPEALDAMARLLRERGGEVEAVPEPPDDAVLSALRIAYSRAGQRETAGHLVLSSVREDPAVLGLIGERLDEAAWRALIGADDPGWDELIWPLVARSRGPEIDARRAAAAAETLFRLEAEMPGTDHRRRVLALLAHFVRGTPPEGALRARFTRRVAALCDDPDAGIRSLAGQLMSIVSLPPAPEPEAGAFGPDVSPRSRRFGP